MTIQNLYTQYLDGKITQSKFLYEARRDQNLDMISSNNSFDDVVKILKNKSIISEKAHKEAKLATGKQEVDIIAKTIDMVNPYEYSRGMDYELDIMDVPATSGDLSEDNVLKAQKKVLANLTKNPQFYFDKMHGKGEVTEEWVEATKKEIDKIGKGKPKTIREGLEEATEFKDEVGGNLMLNNAAKQVYQYIKKNGFPVRLVTDKGQAIGDSNPNFIVSTKVEYLTKFDEKPDGLAGLKQTITKVGIADGGIYISGIGTNAPVVKDKLDGLQSTILSSFNFLEKSGEIQVGPGGGSFAVRIKPDMLKKGQVTEATKKEIDKIGKGKPKTIREGYEDDQMANWTKVVQALSEFGSKDEMKQYLTSLHQSGDTFETVEDYVEDFRNYIADKSLEEHGQYAGRVADVNADSTPLKEKQEAIYKKYAEQTGIPMENLMAMVREAKAKNLQEADDTPEEKKAKDLEVAAEKAKIAASNKKIQDLNQGR
jgi:hypothetical protein